MKNGYYIGVFRIGQFLSFRRPSWIDLIYLHHLWDALLHTFLAISFAFDVISVLLLFFNSFQPSVTFRLETSHLFYAAKQMTGFYTKRSTGLKWVTLER